MFIRFIKVYVYFETSPTEYTMYLLKLIAYRMLLFQRVLLVTLPKLF